MNRLKHRIALILSILLLLPTLAACASEDGPAPESAFETTEAPIETTAESTEGGRAAHKDNLPADLSFDGETVNVYFRDTIEVYSVFGTDNVGDIVTDAIWTRNLTVEDRLDVAFNYIRSASANQGEVTAAIKSVAAAGLNEWDFLLTTNNTTVTRGIDNLMLDLSTLPHLDLTQPYWWQNAMDNVSLTGDSYRYLIGDFMLLNYLRTGAFLYNKNLYEDLYGNPDELYINVLDGTWTYDHMINRAQEAYKDVNGNGRTDADDITGYVIGNTYEEQMCQVAMGFDLQTYLRNDDGSITLLMDSERIFDVSRRLYEMTHQNFALVINSKLSDAGLHFTKGTTLFAPLRFDQVTGANFRNMEDDYGILPYPKYDDSQSEYVTLCHNSSGSASVLITLGEKRYALVGAVLEALGSETYRSVTDVFLESALKMKYSRDSTSGQVIDIIVGSIRKDLVHEYSTYTNDIFNTLVKNAPATEGVYISACKKLSGAAQATLTKTINSLREGK